MYSGETPEEAFANPPISIARKCSLPVRTVTEEASPDCFPQEISEKQVEDFALRAFFYDYCIVSTNQSLSRGYLSGLESMLHQRGWQSDLAKACKVVAFANHGIKLHRSVFLRKAECLYHGLLRSLAKSIECPNSATTIESLMVAMLLGVYEVIMADGVRPDNCGAHAKGIAAILKTGNSPLDLVRVMRSPSLDQSSNLPMRLRQRGVFLNTHTSDASKCIEGLLLRLEPIWKSVDIALPHPLTESERLHQLQDEAMALDQAFAEWQETRINSIQPWAVGHVSQRQAGPKSMTGQWPGSVHAYFDLYIAYIWNTSRAARIFLIDLIIKISQVLGDRSEYNREIQDARCLIEDLLSSIPFHLAEDLQIFLRDTKAEQLTANIDPGRKMGGVLLMYPIHLVSKLDVVPQEIRNYLTECLEWIATNMGIGQASRFAKVRTLPLEETPILFDLESIRVRG